MPTEAPSNTQRRAKKRILIVDDSAAVRQALRDIIDGDPDLEVMAVASDPYVAVDRIRKEVPDAIILDIEMPRMDGLTFLRKIMAQRPIPVVICSTLTEQGSQAMMQAFEAGAVEVITKPRVDTAQQLQESRMLICDAVKAAAYARMRSGRNASNSAPAPAPTPRPVEAKLSADEMLPPLTPRKAEALRASLPRTDKVICIGASTGGTEALKKVLEALPANAPGVVIVQHMPETFTAAFATRLNGSCAIEVKEAADGDEVRAGRALIAPGGRHMMLRRSGRNYRVRVTDGPYVSRHRPSVDVLFRSAAQTAGANAIGVIMTGMGDDGARCMLEMREMGAWTLAQDERSCVVFGMPKEAIEHGAIVKVAPLDRLAAEVLAQARCAAARAPA